MKFVRPLLIGVVVLVVLAAIGVGLALTPSVQTWAARKAIASQPGIKAQIGRVAVGLGSVRLTDIRFEQPGTILTLPSAEIDLPVLSAAGQKIFIKRLVAKGWTLDLTDGSATAAAIPPSTTTGASGVTPSPANATSLSPRAADALPPARPISSPASTSTVNGFNGVFSQLQLPVDLSLDDVALEGDVIFSTGPGQPPSRAHVVITGGQLGAGRDGAFVITAEAKLADPAAPVTSLVARSQVSARMDTARTFQKFALVSDLTATGSQFPQGTQVHAAVTAAREAAGETYDVAVESSGKRFLTLKAALPPGASQLTGNVDVAMQDTDLAPFALGQALPGFNAQGGAKFTANTTFTAFTLEGALNAALSQLEVIMPELKAVGDLQVVTTFSVGQEGEAIRVTALSLKANGAQPVVAVDALQPFEFVPATGELRVANPANDLVNIVLQGLPLAWAQPFAPDLAISGSPVQGAFVVRAAGGGFAVRPRAPITIAGLAIAQAGKPLVQNLDVSLSAAADYTPQGWQADVTDLSASSGGVAALKLAAKASQAIGRDQPIKASGTYTANLPALMAQPVAAEFAVLTKGVAQGDFTATLAAKQEIGLKLQLIDLVAVTNEVLPKVTADVRATVLPDGHLDAHVPLLFEQAGRTSDLTLSAAATPAGEKLTVKASVTSNLIHIEDVKILLAPFASTEEAKKEPTKPVGDGPPWEGIAGELKLALKKVIYSPDFQLTDIDGTVAIAPDALTLDNLRAAIGEGGTFKVGGRVGYDAKAAEHYALKADVALTNFDAGPFFRAVNPGRTPPVEGRFDLTTQLAGSAKDLPDLANTSSGDLKLTSRGGTLRALAFKVDDKAEKAAGLVSGLGGLIGAFGGSNPTAKRIADGTKAVGDLSQQLAALNYDQMNVELARSPNSDYQIKDFTLISPTMRLTGGGSIRYQPGASVLNMPLGVSLQVGARDGAADSLRALRLLGETSDNLGYWIMTDKVTLDGTLANVGTAQLQKLFSKAVSSLLQ